jgi:hypothetical protein
MPGTVATKMIMMTTITILKMLLTIMLVYI